MSVDIASHRSESVVDSATKDDCVIAARIDWRLIARIEVHALHLRSRFKGNRTDQPIAAQIRCICTGCLSGCRPRWIANEHDLSIDSHISSSMRLTIKTHLPEIKTAAGLLVVKACPYRWYSAGSVESSAASAATTRKLSLRRLRTNCVVAANCASESYPMSMAIGRNPGDLLDLREAFHNVVRRHIRGSECSVLSLAICRRLYTNCLNRKVETDLLYHAA